MSSEQQKVIYLFGSFQLDPRERQLRRNDEVIRLQRKAFDVLLVLVRSSGQLVTKDELMREVWGGSVVEDANLTVHISTLRKALSEDARGGQYIESVPKFGYRFVSAVREISDRSTSELVLPETSERDVLTLRVSENRTFHRAAKWLIPAAITLAIFPILFLAKSLTPRIIQPPTNMVLLPTEARAVATAISADGKFVAYSVSERGQNSLWIRETVGEGARQLISPEQPDLWGIAFSPSENYLYYNRGSWDDAALYRLKVPNGSNPEKLREVVNSPIAISPDGTQISYIYNLRSQGESMLMVANADGGDPHSIAMRKQPSYFQFLAGPAWSSDGKTLAVIVEDGSRNLSSLVGYSVADGTEKVLPAPGDWQVYRDLEWLPDGTGLVVSVRANSPTERAQVWELSYPSGKARRITNDRNDYESVSLARSNPSLVGMVTQADSVIWLVPDVHNPTGLRQLRFSAGGNK